MRSLTCLGLVALVLTGSIATSATAQFAQYVPSQTKIAVLPILNESVEKWQELKDRQIQKGADWFSEEFGGRGFQLVPSEEILARLVELKINFGQELQRNQTNLRKLGQALNAELVILIVITESSQKIVNNLFSPWQEGKATIKVWLVDTQKDQAILSAQQVASKTKGDFFFDEFDKGMTQPIRAMGNALRDALKNFLKPYPKLKKR